jgi:hypothetical protein
LRELRLTCSRSAARPATPTIEWDLILFSDSSGRGGADRYAAHIEGGLDVTVSVHDLAASSLGAGSVLAALRGESSPYPSSDGVHKTAAGCQVIAGLLRELGYDPVTP